MSVQITDVPLAQAVRPTDYLIVNQDGKSVLVPIRLFVQLRVAINGS